VPEWRYGLDNEVLPWYPSSRMFRQAALDDWPATLQRVEAALLTWAPSRAEAAAGSPDRPAIDTERHSASTID
jgi:predicted transcriptional regulator